MNLLTDPLFRTETQEGLRQLSLPALLSAPGTNEVESLSGLQRHQEDAFHIFLCQLAASVLVREKKTNPIQDEAIWRNGIRRLPRYCRSRLDRMPDAFNRSSSTLQFASSRQISRRWNPNQASVSCLSEKTCMDTVIPSR